MPPVLPLTVKQLHQLNISIRKAVNSSETPVKEKHVRSAIIGTHQEKSGSIFWMFMLRQPLEEDLIVAWKFCHVLHKVLREGHPRVIPDSQRYKGKLDDIGKLWQHLAGYGKLVWLYVQLLIMKLNFHERNPRLPGNLQVTAEELEAIGENDINVYFEMSVEMFDYMDDILKLQRAVFASLNLPRSNSMTPCGQCRLAPLIPCIQDASQLYDYCVKILFKLHGALPADTLTGHRDRFSKQFQELKDFYNTTKHMEYFKHLITIPSLPEKPPNFLIQAELRSYVTPIVVLPPEEPLDGVESVSAADDIRLPDNLSVDTLVDTSDASSLLGDQLDSTRNGSVSPDALAERDSLIEHLHQENGRQRQEIHALRTEYQRVFGELQTRLSEMEFALSSKNNEMSEEMRLVRELRESNSELATKLSEIEERNKIVEEKFRKLKDVYSKLREEHITLIRKKAELEKQLGGAKISEERSERRAEEAEIRLQEVIQGQASVEHETQRVAQARKDLDEVRLRFDAAKTENLGLVARLDFVTSEKAALEGDLHDLLAQKEELERKLENFEVEAERRCGKIQTEAETAFRELFLASFSESESILQDAIQTIDGSDLAGVTTCSPDYLKSLLEPLTKSLDELEAAYNEYEKEDTTEEKRLVRCAIKAAYRMAVYLIHSKSTSNASPDIALGDELADESKRLAFQSLLALTHAKEKRSSTQGQIATIKSRLLTMADMIKSLSEARGSVEHIGNLVENELVSMDKAIEEAANGIRDMLDKSRAADSGLKLEVNEKILDSCTELMRRIRNLVRRSRLLQTEIVNQGKGTASATEFYKRNHQWSEGLISAAKAIAEGANFLLEAADKVVSGRGKFEQLVVASQGIAASTAQLVVASRVKAERSSSNLAALAEASKEVTQATGNVVATAKSCGQLVEENEDLDVSGLSLHQAKRLEMEAQVRVLELEKALEMERLRLAALRRYHYRLDGEAEG